MLKIITIIVIFLLNIFIPSITLRAESTLEKIKKELLRKEVIVAGHKCEGIFEEKFLLNWFLAEEDNNQKYKIVSKPATPLESLRMLAQAPYRLRGSRGTVIEIIPRENPPSGWMYISLCSLFLDENTSLPKRKQGAKTDLFGDPISDDSRIDPYFDIVVKLNDGRLLIAFASFLYLSATLELASDADALKRDILDNIDSLLGKTIYPVAESKIFLPDSDVNEILENSLSKISKLYVSNLTPLTIVKAKYLETEKAIAIKVSIPGGKSGIIITRFYTKRWFPFSSIGLSKQPFFEKAISGFLKEIPNDLSKPEIEAIKNGTIFKGMSDTALEYSKGRPKRKNRWTATGEQWIYENNYYVYLIKGKIVDWQRF